MGDNTNVTKDAVTDEISVHVKIANDQDVRATLTLKMNKVCHMRTETSIHNAL